MPRRINYLEKWKKEHPGESMIWVARLPVEGDVGPTVELGELNLGADTMLHVDSAGDAEEISDAASAQILIAQGTTTVPSWNAVGGDITIGATGTVAIASGVIVNADVKSDAAIEFSKLESLTDGNILVGNGSNVAVSVNPSGDVDISNTGVFSIAAGVIVDADLASGVFANITGVGALTQDVNFDGNNVDNLGVAFLKEQANADADVAGSGQIWVKTATPNLLFFTNDAGTDFQVATLAGTETFTNKSIAASQLTGIIPAAIEKTPVFEMSTSPEGLT